MKRQIRRGVFETNSSSIHSLTMCMKSDYSRWTEDNLFLFTGFGWCYPDDNKPQKNHFYTKEEAIAFEKLSKYPPSEDFDWNDEDAVMEMLHDNEWYDFDYWDDYYGSEYETFEENLTTPSGDEIIAFGYYGHD